VQWFFGLQGRNRHVQWFLGSKEGTTRIMTFQLEAVFIRL
jgi:hypothetical protein